jgi:c-di-GMP-binding flagellar brake protein YcgR
VDTLNSPEKETKTHYGILNVERRKYPRFSVDLPIEYYRIDKPAGSRGRALDISEGGLLIYFPERMEIGQCLRLRLFFSMGSELNTIELLSEVAWVDMRIGEDWGDYRTGVKFVDISPDDMTKLKNFLISLSQPPYTR